MMNEFNILDSPLDGTNLIEASAGTGKTWTISMIYLRLVTENDLSVENILVVTFTVPATAELRTRIRECIRHALDYLEHGTAVENTSIAEIIDRNRKRPGLRERLHTALRGFDEACVFTIHAFCQQVLSDNAFESGSPFSTGITTDNRVPGTAVADYWRRTAYSLPDHAAYIFTTTMDLQSMLSLYRKKPMAPEYRLLPEVSPASAADVEDAYAAAWQCYRDLCAVWNKTSGDVKEIVTTSPSINRQKFKSNFVASYISSTQKYIEGCDPLMWNDKVAKFTADNIRDVSSKGEPPVASYFDAAQRMLQCLNSYNDVARRFRITVMKDLFDYADRRSEKLTASSGEMGFDDLIRNVHRGLGPDMAGRLREKVSGRYRAALIDEFQDTDSMQFAIFNSMFGNGTSLFLIGDPKQAIYRFRGADIFSYMEAAEKAGSRYTLGRNWRSTPGLIDAVNRVFGGCRNPFVFDRIEFKPVRPGKDEQEEDLLLDGRPVEPLLFELVDYIEEEDGHDPGKDRLIAARLTSAINSMLTGNYTIGGKRLMPADIAVLVRSNYQASLVKSSLSRAGIPAVTRAAESVFTSYEAAELYFILSAVINPADQRRLRTALSTSICGYSAEQVALMAGGGAGELDLASSRFYSYREAWSRGFMDMFIMFMEGESVAARLFSGPGGGRAMANILHIAELLDTASVAGLSPADTINSLVRFIADPPEGEEYSMRLETDEEAVNVMTMHSSKGLEFPVVFCPYLAYEAGKRDDVIVYHESGENAGRPVVYIDGNPPEEVRERKKQEDEAESARLIYVALTRAKSHCSVMMKITANFEKTVLSKILFSSRDLISGQLAGGIDRSTAEQLLKIICKDSGGSIGFCGQGSLAVSIPYSKAGAAPRSLQCMQFSGDVSQRWRMYSYSAISASMHEAEERNDEGASVPFRPGPGLLPPGTRSGLCLHEIFEKSDFTWDSREQFGNTAAASLKKFGFGAEFVEPAVDMVMKVLRTPLNDDGLRLSLIPNGCRLSELEFHFPVESLSGLRKIFSGDEFSTLVHAAGGNEIESIAGMMKGYIDLVFEHNSLYYIVDWKSNMLELSHGDYSRESILAEMKKHNYHLQYFIYTVALHRYLRSRLGDAYDYDKHFGGVFYLFIRGMNGADSSGVFSAKPGFAFTNRLDGMLGGRE